MTHKIISIGEVLWDLFPTGERFGGAPANFACHAAIAGADVMMISAVGDDPRGRKAREILVGYGIDVSLLQVVADVATGTVGVELDGKGKPSFTIHEPSAWDRLQDDGLMAAVRNADLVCFGTLGQRADESRRTIRKCIEVAREVGIPRVVDINLRAPFYDDDVIRDSIELASVLKLSDEELKVVAGALAISKSDDEGVLKEILSRGSLEMVVMTRGAEGAMLVTADEVVEQPGVAVEVRDTVGAGDAFTATFVCGLLEGESFDSVLKKANTKAAEVCGISGAVP